MERAVVARERVHCITVDVTSAQSLLKWEFMSVDYDIGFGIYYEVDGAKQEVLSMTGKESHVIPENGAHVCEGVGTYVIQFDNSYSWTRSKELFYSIDLIPPDSLHHAASPLSNADTSTTTPACEISPEPVAQPEEIVSIAS